MPTLSGAKRRLVRTFVEVAHGTLRNTPKLAKIRSLPVFIVGCGHSGTTLLLRVLGAHPAVYPILDESNAFLIPDPKLLRQFDLEAWVRGKDVWIEKTPRHVHHMDEILARRPETRFIVIRRDGRNVALSLRERSGGGLEDGIRRWLRDNEAADRWRGHPQVLFMQYEDLIVDLEGTVRRVLDFVGLPFARACLDFHRNYPALQRHGKPAENDGTRHTAYRQWQVSQPIFDSRDKWRKAMTPEELAIFNDLAGDAMRRYGYSDGDQG